MDSRFIRLKHAAKGFFDAAILVRDKMCSNDVTLPTYGPVYTANLSFSCELYLKYLLLAKGKIEFKDKAGHNLVSLYDRLDEDTKTHIIKEYNSKCCDISKARPNVQLRELDDCLADYNTAFEDWRYWYEGNKTSKNLGWIDFECLVKVISDNCNNCDL